MTFLALGDSYTIGESVAPDARWPNQLTALLSAEGFAMQPLRILATTGWTTSDLLEGIRRARLARPYALVTLQIGVNNQYQGLPAEQYREQFRELLGEAIALAGGQPANVLVMSIPDWGATPFAEGRDRARIGREIDAFNAANREETAGSGARYVDLTDVSRKAATDPGLTARDGLHPSPELYRRWALLALPEARAALGR